MQIYTHLCKFAHVNKEFQKTCNTFFVCLNVSNQLSNFHGDIKRLKILPYTREIFFLYAYKWDMFGCFSKLSPNGILRGFFSLTQDMLRIQNQLSLLLLQFVQPFLIK